MFTFLFFTLFRQFNDMPRSHFLQFYKNSPKIIAFFKIYHFWPGWELGSRIRTEKTTLKELNLCFNIMNVKLFLLNQEKNAQFYEFHSLGLRAEKLTTNFGLSKSGTQFPNYRFSANYLHATFRENPC